MIYLDHASATPVSKKAREAMEPYFSEDFFNPGAPYLPAKHAREAYEEAKSEIARTIGAKGVNLVITSGATEATNLAFTVADPESGQKAPTQTDFNQETPAQTALSQTAASQTTPARPREVLVLETEHASVLNTAKKYNYKTIKVKPKSGLIDIEDLKAKITKNTVLISVALVNNELGTIQPFSEIAEIVQEERLKRLKNDDHFPLYLHSDVSQAPGLLNVNVARLKADLLTLNSAKVYGPKGVGALYMSREVKLRPIASGGGQEQGLRSGTENVPGVVGFATAAAEAKKHVDSNRKKYQKIKDLFKKTLSESAEITPLFLGSAKHQLASFCPVSFPGLDAERLIYKLETAEVYVSTGAACAASRGEKSHVLKAVGLADAEIAGSLRISFGELNDEESAKIAAKEIAKAVNEEAERLGM